MKNNITSPTEYQDALRRVGELMHLLHPANSPKQDVENYEDNVLKITLPTASVWAKEDFAYLENLKTNDNTLESW
jgi:hypothetical protein